MAQLVPNWLAIAIFYALPYILCGYDVLRLGLKSILNKDFFNEFTLMGGATIAAIALVRCSSRVTSANNAITTADTAPAPAMARPIITP